MRISSGISQFDTSRISGSSVERGRVYLWPKYPGSKVSRIQKVQTRPASSPSYIKASDSERDKILEALSSSSFSEYSENAAVRNRGKAVRPGIIFDALA